MTDARVVIIGYGNDLRGDDALGPMVARELQSLLHGRDDVRIESCQGLTPDLALPLASCELAVFVDCSMEGPVGAVVRRDVAPVNDSSLSMVHFLDPPALLAWTQKLYDRVPRGVLLTVAGATFEISETLSPKVAAAMPLLLKQILDEVGEVCHA